MFLKNEILRFAAVFSLLFGIIACAPLPGSSQTVAPTRIACAPRPTRAHEMQATPTRDPFPKSPTTAPSPTPGPPQTVGLFVYPTLEQPLVNERLVLQKIYEMELRSATEWKNPWCVESLELEPGRILLKRYNSENEYNAIFGGWSINGDSEPVWVVTILGEVKPPPMPGGWGNRPLQYLTYIIGERTGAVNGMSGGVSTQSLTVTPIPTRPPRTRKPRTPKARTPIIATPNLTIGTPTLVATETP